VPNYCVNSEKQSNGDHEVHNTDTCSYLPATTNRVALGSHPSCKEAVAEAKRRGYAKANGCYHCSYACHTS
jgi:hypothetical protein